MLEFVYGNWKHNIFLAQFKELIKLFSKSFYTFFVSCLVFNQKLVCSQPIYTMRLQHGLTNKFEPNMINILEIKVSITYSYRPTKISGSKQRNFVTPSCFDVTIYIREYPRWRTSPLSCFSSQNISKLKLNTKKL